MQETGTTAAWAKAGAIALAMLSLAACSRDRTETGDDNSPPRSGPNFEIVPQIV